MKKKKNSLRVQIVIGLVLALALTLAAALSACLKTDEQSFFTQADIFFEKGNFQKAVDSYNHYLGKYPRGSYRDKALFKIGQIQYFSLRERIKAIFAFNSLLDEFPNSDYSYEARGIIASVYADELNDYNRAAIEYRYLLHQKPNGPKAALYHYQITRCYFLLNRIEEAIPELETFIDKYPDSEYTLQAYSDLGGAYLIQGLPEKALVIYRFMLDNYSESQLTPTIEFKIAVCFEGMGRLQEALAQYKKVKDIYENPDAVDIRIRGVESRLQRRDRPVKKTIR